jgi:hypothetical protein
MIRKTILAAAAIAALGATVLTPSTADAGWKGKKHWHGHHHWHGGFGFYKPYYFGGYDCYFVKRPWGLKKICY